MTAGLTRKVVTKSGVVRHYYHDPVTGRRLQSYLVAAAIRLSYALREHLDAARSALATLGMADDADSVISFAVARLSASPAKPGPRRRGNDVSAKVARDLESLGIKPPEPGGKGEKEK